MNISRITTWVVFSLTLSQVVLAQASISLDLPQAIKRSIEHSLSIEAVSFEVEEAKQKLAQAKAAYVLPNLTLQTFLGPITDLPTGYGPEANFPNLNTNITDLGWFVRTKIEGIQPIFAGNKLQHLRKAAQNGVESFEAKKKVKRNELIYQVKQVYYGLTFLLSLKEFLNEIKDKSDDAQKRVKDLLESGSSEVTDIDLLRITAFQSETTRRIIETTYGIDVGFETLRILTGFNPGTKFEIQDKTQKLEPFEFKSVDHYIQRAWVARPEVDQIKTGVQAQQHLAKSKKADYFPQIFLGGRWTYAKAPGRVDIDNPFLVDDFNTNNGGATLGLQQNLSFHIVRNQYKEEFAKFLKAKASMNLALQGMELEIRKAYAETVSKYEASAEAEKGFKAGRSWVLASSLNFSAGLVPVQDLLEAFIGYSRVKVGYLDIIREYQSSLANLSRVVGEEITTINY